jgi:predicted metalloprotease with PDZ domain
MFLLRNQLLRIGELLIVNCRKLLFIYSALFLLALQANAANATGVDVRIRVESLTPPRLIIEGERDVGSQIWSFPKTYGGLLGLGERINALVVTDGNGRNVQVRKLGPGEYKAETEATRFRYEVNLEPPARPADSAYVSWLTSDRGLLMLGDLLPDLAVSGNNAPQHIRISVELPESWLIASVETRVSGNRFDINDRDRAVFFVARDLRQFEERVGRMQFALASSGDWAFSARELLKLAKSIVERYTDSVGTVPGKRALLILSPFPGTEQPGRWSAETRGSTVLLLSGHQPGKTAALVQLGMPVTHELFHLWVPNGLALEGNYDWFYEGFTIYQAMLTAQRLNILSFQDFLNIVGRAFDTYLSAPGSDKLSLLEASQRRWTTSSSLIYQKAMLVALLYDLTLRSQTKGKHSLDDVYRELFRRHQTGMPGEQANDVVIHVLSSLPGMQDFARVYIESPSVIDLPALLNRFGLHIERVGLRSQVSAKESLNREQRDLLRRLGYNTAARGAKHN